MPGPKSAGTGVVLRFALSPSGNTTIRRAPARPEHNRRDHLVARIAGVNLPTNKRVVIALQYIHGIGPKIAHEIVGKVNLPAERRVSQLTDAEVLQIREIIDRDYMVEGDLRRETSMNIKRLMDLGCYRGPAPPQGPAGARPAHPYQCAHPQGAGQDHRRQEESCVTDLITELARAVFGRRAAKGFENG